MVWGCWSCSIYLIYPMLLAVVGMLVFFTNASLAEFQVGFFAIFCHFLVLLEVVLDGKPFVQEYFINTSAP